MFHYWWIPASIIFYIAMAWMSVYAKNGWGWVIAMMLLQCFGLWPIIARYSKNIVFDAIIFDTLILLTFFGVLMLMGQMESFKTSQWIGLVLAIAGILLMKGILVR